uniref:Uncharacterized protein n=1 Tax=Grammatophora oceanica TaxID=210454 RepID=A0A7S1YHI8_9STRA|mmetsp:Transcript_46914/g.69765  ORF Transcript_46914/g.69765 Transcript_46914/m.69765 type:complete len:283 (+) Transcript_46914:215-1063(+)|eukprot:CAMPEP_0194050622 /NCGR_PEP_ID=MMETSP0009_2-20130614/36257_1 /TAXON_ID=210454 /ORGANISM="Grammatophora oceanica, Strain CCMP 410" /LENGTH=282 /DNA_ID=CAMNT_0038697347 /DNA_START=143 /DNA_END=991 /DNA_ORIENTATION=+
MPASNNNITFTDMARMDACLAHMRESAKESGKKSQGEVEGGVRWTTILNLQSDAGKKLNGRLGKVLTQEVNRDGRHEVAVEGIQQIKLLKPANLEDIPEENLVRVYRIPSDGEGESHQVLLFPRVHNIFQNNLPRGNSPAMALCGLPLIVKKTTPRRRLGDQSDYDNQWATWLMIDPRSGFAPSEWQSYVGPVYVFRPSGSGDVSGDDMEVINDFLSSLLDAFGDGPDFNPQEMLNPVYFSEFVQQAKSHQEQSDMASALEGLTILGTLDRGLAEECAQIVW